MKRGNPDYFGGYRTILALIILLICQSAYGQFNFRYGRKQESTSFRLVKNLVIVEVFINKKGPFNFVLDTGVGLFLITEPGLVESLPSVQPRTVKINGIGEGEEIKALIYPTARIELGNSIAGDMPVAILKDDPFNLSSFLGMPIHGLIGYELFQSFIVRINYSTKSVTYYAHETAYIPRKGFKIPISIEDRKPYVEVLAELSSGKKEKVKLIIDTGAGHPLSMETKSGIPYPPPKTHIAANLGVGLSGLISGFISRIPKLELGRFHLQNVICAFPDYSNVAAKITNISRNGNLGNNVLKRFNVVFDYQRETMYLRPNYMFREPFEHDMSGMEITTEGENYEAIIVSRVESGSAAEKCGIKKGDRILSINFKEVQSLGIDEINTLFRSKEDRSIVLEVIPSNSEDHKFFVLTLKRRI